MLFFNEEMGCLRDDYVYWLTLVKDVQYAYGNREILVDYRIRKTSVSADKKKVIYPQWRVLREIEKQPLWACIYYMCCWGIISYFKYRK